MEFLSDYGLFLAKAITLVAAIAIVISLLVSVGMKGQGKDKGHISVRKMNDYYDDMADVMREHIIDENTRKQQEKERKKEEKAKSKEAKKRAKQGDAEAEKKRVYVISFDGDIKASPVSELRQSITAILSLATDKDEVVVCLESPGGMVHGYGLAASQLARITQKGIPLTAVVDKVAASGGYMMACVADKILAAPFAVLGSIGVIAQIPNFHRLLKKNDIDYELLTAGEYKRTLTMFGENTEKGRQKFVDDLEDTHVLFKEFVSENRSQVDIEKVATGEVWFGKRALEQKLVDELMTSDEYLTTQAKEADIYEVEYVRKKSLQEKVGVFAQYTVDNILTKIWERINSRFTV